MRIRKYNGKDMQEALAKVRSDLGSEAVILNSRKVKRRGVAAWFSKPYFEVLAAVDENYLPTNRGVSRRSASQPEEPRLTGSVQDHPSAPFQADPVMPARAAAGLYAAASAVGVQERMLKSTEQREVETKSLRADAKDDLETLKKQVDSMAAMLDRLQNMNPSTEETASDGPVPESQPPIQIEVVKPLKSKAGTTSHDLSMKSDPVRKLPERAVPEDGFEAMQRLLEEREVDAVLAARIVDKVREMLPPHADEEDINRQTRRVLAAALGKPEAIKLRDDGKPVVVTFIGPTGVGKTTTLAKLAADFALSKGKRVGLITADTYRIAAVEQLKTYAEILNVPIAVVYSPNDMQAAIRGYADRDVILVDTAGRSHRNKQQFEELRQLLAASPPDEVFLVLSVNTGRAAVNEVLEHYAFMDNYKLLFTKLDETPVPGIIFNARLKTGRPLSYVTAGQSVPDDLEIADPNALAQEMTGSGSRLAETGRSRHARSS